MFSVKSTKHFSTGCGLPSSNAILVTVMIAPFKNSVSSVCVTLGDTLMTLRDFVSEGGPVPNGIDDRTTVCCVTVLNVPAGDGGGPGPGDGGAQIKVEKIEQNNRKIPTATPTFQSMKRLVESNPIWSMQLRVGKQSGMLPSPVCQILNMVFHEDLIDDEDYQAIVNECREEASKLGRVLDIVIPRPDKVDQTKVVEGVGKCFVYFEDITAARKFHAEVNGRKFDNRTMCVSFYPLENFQKKEYVLRGNA